MLPEINLKRGFENELSCSKDKVFKIKKQMQSIIKDLLIRNSKDYSYVRGNQIK